MNETQKIKLRLIVNKIKISNYNNSYTQIETRKKKASAKCQWTREFFLKTTEKILNCLTNHKCVCVFSKFVVDVPFSYHKQ